MKMNLPNKLTMIRVLIIPLFIIFLLLDVCGIADKWIALALFIAASLTDWLDGKIARERHLVTNFGKFMDPLADKLLVCSALICFVELGQLPSWYVIVIISREFIISGFRLVAVDNGVVIAASYWGKVKTAVSMVMIGFLIADLQLPLFVIVTKILIVAALILTVVSLIDYIVKNKDIFKGSM